MNGPSAPPANRDADRAPAREDSASAPPRPLNFLILGGTAAVNSAKALAAGLTLRPVEVTASDTLEWFQAEGREGRFVSAEREREILERWEARQG